MQQNLEYDEVDVIVKALNEIGERYNLPKDEHFVIIGSFIDISARLEEKEEELTELKKKLQKIKKLVN